MKNFNPTNYPDYMYQSACTLPHSQQPKRWHDGKPYHCKPEQKRPSGFIDLTGTADKLVYS